MKAIILNYKRISGLLSLFAVMALAPACEEVVNVDLNGTESKIVIEGQITDKPGNYQVLISKTTDYFIPGDYPKVRNAEVTITDDLGLTDHLTEVQPGVYQTDSLKGVPGRTYSLNVVIDGRTYTAQSTMPEPTELDSVTYEKDNAGPRNKSGNKYKIICNFQDQPDYENFCRFKVYRNSNDYINKIYTYYDKLYDGNYIHYSRIRDDFSVSDTVIVEMWSIDKAAYTYFSTLKDAIAADDQGNPIFSNSTPANPVSNITGNALGYFAAYAVRIKSAIIK